MNVLAALLIAPALAGVLDDGDPARGKEMYLKLCAACHSLKPGVHGHLGPTLHGVAGRKAGSVEGYDFSPAMAEDGRVWTAENLDAYLEDPKATIPGSRMKFYGIKDRYERADMIAFLKGLGR
ncbi:MAG: c-type cytochrome [Rhodospirillales bacterium]|nr:MAG: c-type cytochrome [Rhodospirillales bacterium]